jgi:hypothetical protein
VSVLAQGAVWPDRVRPLRRVEFEALVAQGLLDNSKIESSKSIASRRPDDTLRSSAPMSAA